MSQITYPYLAKNTLDLAHDIYSDLNFEIFQGRLPGFLPIEITSGSRYWGACIGGLDAITGDPYVEKIELSSELFPLPAGRNPSFQPVRIILAHEMIHAWQWMVDGPERIDNGSLPEIGHGESFHQWKPIFLSADLPLQIGYTGEDLNLPGEIISLPFGEDFIGISPQQKTFLNERKREMPQEAIS